MTKIIDGKKLAQELASELTAKVSDLVSNGKVPKLVIVGSNPDERSLVYIRMKQKRAEEIGITTEFVDIADMSADRQIKFVTGLNSDQSVHGVILQLPLQGWGDPQELLNCIAPSKDVDGLTNTSQNDLAEGKPGFVPATPLAVMEILRRNNVVIEGKTATVIGRSKLVGEPLKYLLEQAGATVLVGHREVPSLSELTLQSSIVMAAAGKPGLVTGEMIQDGTVVVDVGITEVDGKLKGDVEFNSVSSKASLITPVPGGVGPMTVVMLLRNVVSAVQ